MQFSNIISLISSLLLFASEVTATTSDTSPKICRDYLIPVNTTNLALKASYIPPKTNAEVVDFFNTLAGRSGAAALNLWIGQENRTAIYNISATICSPRKRSKDQRTILLATHGLGYDKRYWDSDIQPEKYSFVDFAIAQGYSVFYYDRLGYGQSTKVPGYEIPQALTQLTILRQLTILLRSGKYTGDLDSPPSKIVHVGHSYGSILSTALIATTPSLSDGAILTGIAYAGFATLLLPTFAFRIANFQAPGKWAGRDNYYVTGADVNANVAVFFKNGTYDQDVLWYTEDVKQPVGLAELVSVGSDLILPQKAPGFTKPVMILTGEFDLAFCAANCTGLLENDGKTRAELFPNATDFKAVQLKGVGHGINFSYNATGAYKIVTDYLKKNGL